MEQQHERSVGRARLETEQADAVGHHVPAVHPPTLIGRDRARHSSAHGGRRQPLPFGAIHETSRRDGRQSPLHPAHERRGRAHVAHREGPDPALDDRRGRAVRPAARLRPAAGAHRPGDLPDPPLPPARAVAAVPARPAALVGRVDLRPRLPPAPHAAARRPAPSARCSTRCSRWRRPASTAPGRCGSSR